MSDDEHSNYVKDMRKNPTLTEAQEGLKALEAPRKKHAGRLSLVLTHFGIALVNA